MHEQVIEVYDPNSREPIVEPYTIGDLESWVPGKLYRRIGTVEPIIVPDEMEGYATAYTTVYLCQWDATDPEDSEPAYIVASDAAARILGESGAF